VGGIALPQWYGDGPFCEKERARWAFAAGDRSPVVPHHGELARRREFYKFLAVYVCFSVDLGFFADLLR
jgi:hypothetical protein